MTASTVEKWREDRQGGAPWLEEVEQEILASGIGNPPKTDSSTAVVRGANPKKVNAEAGWDFFGSGNPNSSDQKIFFWSTCHEILP